MTNLQDLKPGEWVYLPDYNDDGPAQVVYEVGHGPIAEVQPYRDRSPESLERGRIMAAGKILLAACEQALAAREIAYHGDDKILAILREAIAKAKGNNQTE